MKLQKTISIKGKNKLFIVPKETNGDNSSSVPKMISGFSSANKGNHYNSISNEISNNNDNSFISSMKTLELYKLIQTVKESIHSHPTSKFVNSAITSEQK